MSIIEKHCLQCGKPTFVTTYQAEKGRGKFCSNSCHGKYRTKAKVTRIEKNCLFCNTSFDVTPSNIKRKFCSPECYRAYRKCTAESKKQLRHCKNCGQEFDEYPSRIKDNRGHFCSKACTNEWKRRNQKHKICFYCGKPFSTEPNKGSGNRGQYCSNRCKITALNHKRLGITCQGDIIEDFEFTHEIAHI